MCSPVSQKAHLCVVHTATGPIAQLWEQSFWLMQDAGLGREPILDDGQRAEPVRAMLAAIPSDLYWMVGSYEGAGQESIGMGRNKKVRTVATRLALALSRFSDPTPPSLSWQPPPAFTELVEHVRQERDAPLLQVPAVAMLLAGCQAAQSMALPGVADAYQAPASTPGLPSSSFQEPLEPLEPAVSAAMTTAKESQGSLVSMLKERARGRGRLAIDRAPTPVAEEAFRQQLLRWLQVRQLDKVLRRVPERDFDGSQFWSYEPSYRVLQAGPGWQLGYHGTWWYFLWSIVDCGVLLESQDEGAGHEFWEPGLYCTTKFETASEYGRSHCTFGDGMYHRVLLEVLFDPREVRRQRERGGVQIVLPSKAVSLQGVHFLPNRPPIRGEERLDSWDCRLEAVPSGCPWPAEVNGSADPGTEAECTVIWHPPAAA